jgi:putative oxygen-independent coproporphyrinogen III oxidase
MDHKTITSSQKSPTLFGYLILTLAIINSCPFMYLRRLEEIRLSAKAVYIHIPFCTNKCYYCDFTAYTVKGQPVDDYLSALDHEMRLVTTEVPPHEIETIFIGGGTPTVLTPEQMERLLEMIQTHFPKRSSQLEFTIEANPGTTTDELLKTMIDGGVNRISFGAQTFRPDLLKRLGRIHGVEEIEESVIAAREAGFQNISLDLMFGLPEQSLEDLHHTLHCALSLNPEHFSCYSLKVEEGTLFYHLAQKDQLPLPDEEEELKMYQSLRSILREAGYEQYEVSNFAKPGRESRHNSIYWLNEEYYGFGTGAHGYLQKIRYANVKSVSELIRMIKRGERPVSESYVVTEQEDMENFMILGLRMMKGVSRSRFQARYHKDMMDVYGTVVQKLAEQGLLKVEPERVVLTEKGLIFGNEAFAAFLI